MKKTLRYIVMLLILCLCTAGLMSGCQLWQMNKNEKNTEYFYYYVRDFDTGKEIRISRLTDAGKELENIVIPDEIEGYPVTTLSGGTGSSKVKKLYVSKNVEYISYQWLDARSYKTIYIRYDCTKNSIGGNNGNPYISYISEDICNKNIPNLNYCIANINYLYNYENSINGGIHFIDDLDEGENIAVFPPEPLREGYRFTGWYRDEEGTETFDMQGYVRNAEDGIISLYAGWEET